MRKTPFILVLVYSFFLFAGSAYGIGEKTILIGEASSWEAMETRRGIAETSRIRPHPALLLAGSGDSGGAALSQRAAPEDARSPRESLDLQLSFDESGPERFRDSRGRYDVFASSALASGPGGRFGTGAALFSGREAGLQARGLRAGPGRDENATAGSGEPAPSAEPAGSAKTGGLTLKPRSSALFASGSRIRDFSIEFWLYPLKLENGEQILSLNSSKPIGPGVYLNQRIQCAVSRNRLQWSFGDFFFSPDEKDRASPILSGSPVLPRAWSHHLIRFDADLGLLEYLVDGRLEALECLSSTGREGGDVFTPVVGEDSRLELGGRFSGMIDEFRVYRSFLEKPVLSRYSEGGRIESRPLDMGNSGSRVLKIEAFGGLTAGGEIRPEREYSGSGNLLFSDSGEIRLFVRVGDHSFRWNEIPWIPVNPGAELPDTFRGRYVQIAADFYPGEGGESSPYLSELRIVYRPAEPPPPPAQVFALGKDGAVELSWKASPFKEAGGYLVYYGVSKGEYFGDPAMPGPAVRSSPIDAGNRTSIRIEGLNNGTLYYFAVAAYNAPAPAASKDVPGFAPEPGEFSREAAARPLPALP